MAVTTESLRDRDMQEARKRLEDLRAKRAEIDTEIQQAELLIQAWQNFQLTLEGKFAAQLSFPEPKTRKASGPRAPRGDRGKIRIQILTHLAGGDLSAEAINSELRAGEPDGPKKPAIANLLSKMKDEDLISQTAKRQPYSLTAKGRHFLTENQATQPATAA